jgi:hypothetical protein
MRVQLLRDDYIGGPAIKFTSVSTMVNTAKSDIINFSAQSFQPLIDPVTSSIISKIFIRYPTMTDVATAEVYSLPRGEVEKERYQPHIYFKVAFLFK